MRWIGQRTRSQNSAALTEIRDNSMTFTRQILMVATLSMAAVSTAGAQSIHYGWKSGDVFSYSIVIESSEPTYTDIMSGQVFCTVRSSDVGGAVLVVSGQMSHDQQGKDGQPMGRAMPSRLTHLQIGVLPATQIAHLSIAGRPIEAAQDHPEFLPGDIAALLAPPIPEQTGPPGAFTRTARILIEPLASAPPGQAQQSIPVSETLTTSVAVPGPKTCTLDEVYEARAQELVRNVPRISMTGTGKIVFDEAAGIVRYHTMDLQLSNPAPNGVEKTAITIKCKLISFQPANNPGGAGAPGGNTNAGPIPSTGPTRAMFAPGAGEALDDDHRSQLLALLKSKDSSDREAGTSGLANAVVDNHCGEVALALAAVLTDRDVFVRQYAVKALGAWLTAETVAPLAQMVNDPDPTVRQNALDVLIKLKDPATAGLIAARLADPADRAKAGEALKAIGPPAEQWVTPILKDKDAGAQMEACSILKDIGTLASRPALEALMGQGSPFVGLAANAAITAIEYRSGQYHHTQVYSA
jgi:hypothetical protein